MKQFLVLRRRGFWIYKIGKIFERFSWFGIRFESHELKDLQYMFYEFYE